jgi:hypothetical protein
MEKIGKIWIPAGAFAALLTMLLLLMSSLPFAAADNVQTASMTATLGTIVSVQVTPTVTWGDLTKGADNQVADAVTQVTIKSITNVTTDVSEKMDDLTGNQPGADNVIEASNIWISQTNPMESDNMQMSNSYQAISWMTDIAVPGAADNVLDSYFYISTASNQTAGTYTGTLYVKAAEST